MKKRFLFILIFSLIFCAGCNAKYTITIDEDGKVEERLYAKEDESFFEQYPNSSKGLVVSYLLDPYIDKLSENNYNVETNINETSGGVIVTKKYDSIEDYVENSIIYKQFTNEIKVEEKNGKVTITANGHFSHSEQNQEFIPVDEATINIDVPFKVEKNNSDSYDDNTLYTWKFEKNDVDNREITITFNKKVIGNKADYPILIILGILGGLLLFGFIIYSRIITGKKLANKI